MHTSSSRVWKLFQKLEDKMKSYVATLPMLARIRAFFTLNPQMLVELLKVLNPVDTLLLAAFSAMISRAKDGTIRSRNAAGFNFGVGIAFTAGRHDATGLVQTAEMLELQDLFGGLLFRQHSVEVLQALLRIHGLQFVSYQGAGVAIVHAASADAYYTRATREQIRLLGIKAKHGLSIMPLTEFLTASGNMHQEIIETIFLLAKDLVAYDAHTELGVMTP